MSKFRKIFSVVIVVQCALSFNFIKRLSAETATTTALAVLTEDIGGRQLAMGGAFTALADDMFGAYYNPAGLAYIQHTEISAAVHNGVLDTSKHYFSVAIPLPLKTFTSDNRPALGFSFLSSSNGDINWNKLASDGSALYRGVSRNAGSDNVFGLTYADTVYTNYFNFDTLSHFFGLTVKFINSNLPNSDGGNVSANTYAFDAGYLIESKEYNTSFGIALNNLGGKVKYINESDSLPHTFRVGAGHKTNGLTLSFDYIRYMKDEINRLRAGMEIELTPLAKIRGGYRFMGDVDGFSVGFGTQIFGLLVDAGISFDDVIDNVYELSAVFRFGKRKESNGFAARGKVRKVKRRYKLQRGKDYKKEETPVYETKKVENTLILLDD